MKAIAVIGCGRIANGSHFPALEQIEGVRIKYACDLIEQKAIDAKERYSNVEQAITDYHVALADPEVEAVFVLTPNYAHYTVTMDALRAGKHVFCEKPIAVNYALSCEMAAEAEKQGKMLNIGVCNRYHKSVEMLHDWVEEGRFGKLYHVNCSFRNFRSIPGLGGASLKTVTCDAYSEMAKDMKSYKYESMWAEDTADTENGASRLKSAEPVIVEKRLSQMQEAFETASFQHMSI